MVRVSILIICFFTVVVNYGAANKYGIDTSLYLEARHCAEKALEWLASSQNAEGYWSNKEHPALTALVLRGFLFAGHLDVDSDKYRSVVAKGFRYLESCVQKDGGIYGKGYENYNTAISLSAFIAGGDKKYEDIIVRANNYLVGTQMDQQETGKTDVEFDGGIGYNKEGHSDMNNTTWALEALYYVKKMREAERQIGSPEDKKIIRDDKLEYNQLNWKAALDFITRCQNLPEKNDLAWASGDSVNKGGFVYFPGNSKAGDMILPDSTVIHRSYGSMSYAGLISLLFAEVDKKDVRVQAVYKWLCRNYTLLENPGLGQEGLYFYFHIMAKALSAYKAQTIPVSGKGEVYWRKELLEKLINLQNSKGFWINQAGRWWENDPALCTAYAVLAMELATPPFSKIKNESPQSSEK